MIKVFDDMEIRAKVNLGTEEAPIWREVEVLTGAYSSCLKVRILNRQGQPYNAATIHKDGDKAEPRRYWQNSTRRRLHT